jgi:hypothetical protein
LFSKSNKLFVVVGVVVDVENKKSYKQEKQH